MTQEEFIQRYTFNIRTDKVGGGSFGSVYKAYDTVLDREVAIKVSEVKYIDGKEFSLREEYNAIKNLPAHPNIANYEIVYTFENVAGIFDYAIMQYYPLGNLSEYLKKNSLNDADKDKLLERILDGIAHLHKHKVLHRDLKPGNILVVDRAGKIIPKITDFGLSKQAEKKGQNTRFSNSFAGGTLQYSSPEQLKGESIKLNTDLWSYGVIAYEVLTGKTLFEATSYSTASAEWQNEVTQQILNSDLEIPLAVLPIVWKAKIKSCLTRDLTKRVQSATALKKLNEVSKDAIVLPEEAPNKEIKKPTLVKEKLKVVIDAKIKDESINKLDEIPKPFFKRKKVIWGFSVLLFLMITYFSVGYVSREFKLRKFKNLVEKADLQYENREYDKALVNYKKADKLKILSISHPVSVKIRELENTLSEKVDVKNQFENTSDESDRKFKPDTGFSVSVKVTPEEAAVLEETLNGIGRPSIFGAKEVVILAPVSYSNGDLKTAYINKKGDIVMAFKYLELKYFSEDRAVVAFNSKYGYIDAIGNEVIPLKYDLADPFSEDLAHVELNKKHGFIDKQGKVVIPLIYEAAKYKFSEGLASVKLNGKWGFINAKGRTIIPFKYTNARIFSEGLAAVELDNKIGYINKNGNTVIEFKYDKVYFPSFFSEGLVRTRLNGKYGYLNTLGQTIIPFRYDDCRSFSEGLAAVKLNNKWGYIDKTGKQIIPFKYDDCGNLSEGLTNVELNNKWGYIDKNGKEIIPFKYDYCRGFSEGLASVELRGNSTLGKSAYINKKGKEIIPPKYYLAGDFQKVIK